MSYRFAFRKHGDYLGLTGQSIISDKLNVKIGQGFCLRCRQTTHVPQGMPGSSGALPLFFHGFLKTLFVYGHPAFSRNLPCELKRKPVRIIQLKRPRPGDCQGPFAFQLRNYVLEHRRALVEAFQEPFFFRPDDLMNVIPSHDKFRISMGEH